MSKDVFQLAGKTILVTGASSGIGRSIAEECARRGAILILLGRNQVRLNSVRDSLAGEGHVAYSCDIRKESDIVDMVSSLPVLDGLVNSAGINDKSLVKSLNREKIDKMFETNLFGPMLLIREILRSKRISPGASIVFISSISAQYAAISNALYASSKGAVDSFIRVLALEVAHRSIRVNGIRPGVVETPLLDSYALKEELEEFKKSYPLGRIGRPEDIAYGVVYLLSDASKWVTGTIFNIDGGVTLK